MISPLFEIADACKPGGGRTLSGFLFRPPYAKRVMEEASLDDQVQLVRKVAKLMSAHGSDVLLTPESEPLPAFHRLRTGLSSKLWQWRTICGWHWRRSPGQDPEHINKLELRALYTALKWRVERQGLCQSRFLHLCDSMVSLHIVNKGRHR